MVRRENRGCRLLPAGPDMIQIAELVALVVVVINAGTVLQFHLVQRAATRYWRRVSGDAREKLFSNGTRSKLGRQWSKVVAARKQRKPSRKLLTHRRDAILATGRYFWYWTHRRFQRYNVRKS